MIQTVPPNQAMELTADGSEAELILMSYLLSGTKRGCARIGAKPHEYKKKTGGLSCPKFGW